VRISDGPNGDQRQAWPGNRARSLAEVRAFQQLRSGFMAHDQAKAIDRAASVLRRRIVTAELKAGTRLSQLEIGTEFKISRHHVREVFRILHAERLITMQPNVGIKVSPLGVLDFEEVHDLRLMLEPMLARMAVPNLTRSHIAALRELLAIMAETEDTYVWLDAHERFHAVIYRQAGRPWMVQIADQGRQVARRYLEILHSDIGWSNRVEVHAEILAAVEAGDSLLVEQLTARHMREAHDPIFKHLSKIALDQADNGSDGAGGADLSLIDRIWERADDHEAAANPIQGDLAGSL